MLMKRWFGWLKIAPLLLLLAGCAQVEIQAPPPTSQPLTVDYTPALRTWQPALYACASTLPEIALFTHEVPAERLDLQAADLALRLGAPQSNLDFFAVQIGEERVIAIVHPENPLEDMGGAILRGLYTGQISNWAEAAPGFDADVQVWTYPPGDETRQTWEAALFGAAPPAVQGLLAPDPQAMLEAVAGEPGALGYLPRSWLAQGSVAQGSVAQGSVRELLLPVELADRLRQPVLAVAAQEPQGAARALLACLQSAQQK
jgi:hypothetical protein